MALSVRVGWFLRASVSVIAATTRGSAKRPRPSLANIEKRVRNFARAWRYVEPYPQFVEVPGGDVNNNSFICAVNNNGQHEFGVGDDLSAALTITDTITLSNVPTVDDGTTESQRPS